VVVEEGRAVHGEGLGGLAAVVEADEAVAAGHHQLARLVRVPAHAVQGHAAAAVLYVQQPARTPILYTNRKTKTSTYYGNTERKLFELVWTFNDDRLV
jgi:hypothetical protein